MSRSNFNHCLPDYPVGYKLANEKFMMLFVCLFVLVRGYIILDLFSDGPMRLLSACGV